MIAERIIDQANQHSDPVRELSRLIAAVEQAYNHPTQPVDPKLTEKVFGRLERIMYPDDITPEGREKLKVIIDPLGAVSLEFHAALKAQEASRGRE